MKIVFMLYIRNSGDAKAALTELKFVFRQAAQLKQAASYCNYHL